MTFFARCVLCLAACFVVIAASAAAQGVRTDLLPPLGSVVRATIASAGEEATAEGVLTEAGVDGLVLEADQGRHIYRIPAEVLLGLDVSRGRDHGRGAILGFAFGALGTGLLLGGAMALAGGDGADCWACSGEERFVVGGALGAALGGSVGLVVGAVIGAADWEPLW